MDTDDKYTCNIDDIDLDSNKYLTPNELNGMLDKLLESKNEPHQVTQLGKFFKQYAKTTAATMREIWLQSIKQLSLKLENTPIIIFEDEIPIRVDKFEKDDVIFIIELVTEKVSNKEDARSCIVPSSTTIKLKQMPYSSEELLALADSTVQ